MEWSPGHRITVAALVGVFATSGLVVCYQRLRAAAQHDGAVYQPATSPAAAGRAAYLKVHVAGAVNKPGLYTFSADDRVLDAIRQAGGEAPDARLDDLNLAAHLRDGMRLYVPGARDRQPDQVIVMTEDVWAKAPPAAPRDAERPPGGEPAKAIEVGAVKRAEAPAAGSRRSGRKEPPSQPVNINQASLEQLQQLPGIGPAMAARIVAYRETQGRFRSPQDLKQVKGIGDKKLAKLLPHVRAE